MRQYFSISSVETVPLWALPGFNVGGGYNNDKNNQRKGFAKKLKLLQKLLKNMIGK